MTVNSAAKETETVALLNAAINGLSTDFMRDFLERLCSQVPEARKFAEETLLTTAAEVSSPPSDSDGEKDGLESSGESEAESSKDEVRHVDHSSAVGLPAKVPRGQKRKVAPEDQELVIRWVQCRNCEELFDVTSNHTGDCVYHEDVKTVVYDSDVWADHDEQCHGRFETFEDDPELADGFEWQCCEQNGNAEGCIKGKHRAASASHKRPKY